MKRQTGASSHAASQSSRGSCCISAKPRCHQASQISVKSRGRFSRTKSPRAGNLPNRPARASGGSAAIACLVTHRRASEVLQDARCKRIHDRTRAKFEGRTATAEREGKRVALGRAGLLERSLPEETEHRPGAG